MSRLVDKLQEGDVIYTSCSDYHLCYHLGIVYSDGKKKLIYHNAPNNLNRYGGSVVAESYDEFIKGRIFMNLIHTKATNADILRVARKCRFETWDTFLFNCEDFVMEVVEGERRSNLRDAYKVGALGLATLLLI